MRRVIIPLKEFKLALVTLDARVPLELVGEVACQIAARPECAPLLHGSDIRMLQTRSYGEWPAFNLFYKFDEKRLYLTHIELRDELEVFDEVELWGEVRV